MTTAVHGAAPCSTTPTQGRTDCAAAPTGLPCWTADPELFFAETPESVDAAKLLCASCPVRNSCLAAAVERAEPWGVWGGELFDRGVVVPRKRPRGRPRNADRERDAAWHTAQLVSVA